MVNFRRIEINLDSALRFLFCLYAFSIPYELIFDILLNIDTIFKPFRIIGLAIIGLFIVKVLRNGFQVDPKEKYDLLFYGVIIYGVLISCVRIISGPFNSALFYNDLFLVGLNAIIFFIYKNIFIPKAHQLRIFHFFVAGLIGNSIYIFYSFFIRGIVARQAGFSDNPNYAALAIGVVITFFLLKSNYIRGFWKQIALFITVLFLCYVFLITGSRTGLIVLIISVFIVFLFSSIYRKFATLLIALLIGLFLFPEGSIREKAGGQLVLVNRINKKLDQEETDVRFVLWEGAFRMLEEEGFWGMGIGQYKDKFEEYFSTSSHLYVINIVERGYYLSTHNDYLAILTDFGLPALILYLFFLGFNFLKLLRNVMYPDEDEAEYRFLIQYKFILICCLIIFGMASENLPNPLFWFLMMIATKSN